MVLINMYNEILFETIVFRFYSILLSIICLLLCYVSRVKPKTRLNTARLTARLSDVHLTIYCILFDYISPHHLFVYGKDDSTHKIFSTIYELRVTIPSHREYLCLMSQLSSCFCLTSRKLSRPIESLLFKRD